MGKYLMSMKVDVDVAISFRGIAACNPIRGVCNRHGNIRRVRMKPAPSLTWKRHPTPSAAMSGYTAFTALRAMKLGG